MGHRRQPQDGARLVDVVGCDTDVEHVERAKDVPRDDLMDMAGRGVIHHTACIDMVDRVPTRSVDCLFTDPPYPAAFLHCYDELAALACHALRPGGLVLTMAGHAHLPDVMQRMAVPGLEYLWTVAYIYERPRAQIHSAKVSVGWKPILAYQRDGASIRDGYSQDAFRVPPRTGDAKRNHMWGQNLGGCYMVAEEWLQRGWTVLDPFCGGGSLLLAAKRRGCRIIGCDSNMEHVETARDTLQDDLIDLTENASWGT